MSTTFNKGDLVWISAEAFPGVEMIRKYIEGKIAMRQGFDYSVPHDDYPVAFLSPEDDQWVNDRTISKELLKPRV